MTLSSMYLSSFVVSSPFLAAIDLTGRGGTTLWLAAAIVATVLTAAVLIAGLATATELLVLVVAAFVAMALDVDAAVGCWTACCRQAQLLAAALGGHALASSARELILRCEPLQLLPHEIFTEQLILSY